MAKVTKKKVDNKPLNNKVTEVAIVLDRSASMGSCLNETIEGFNKQVQTIKDNASKGGETKVSLWTFSSDVNEVYVSQPVERIQSLNRENYHPDGMTSMLDGVGDCITTLETKDNGGDTAFLVIIVSDGQENNSRRFDPEKISTLIKEKEKTDRWTFVYVGANQDLKNIQKMGFAAGNTRGYTATAIGTTDMYAAASLSTENYFSLRSSGATSVNNFWVDKNEDEDSLATSGNVVSVPQIQVINSAPDINTTDYRGRTVDQAYLLPKKQLKVKKPKSQGDYS